MRMIGATMLLVALSACAGQAARNEVLLPAMVRAWPGVRADIARGVAGHPEQESVLALADRIEAALGDGDLDALRIVNFDPLRPWAEAGTVGQTAQESRMERIRLFAQAMGEL